jgi:hypothetical protein
MRRGWMIGALLVFGLLPAGAQEKQNTLTPKEVAAGWILLFDGETDFGWKPRGDAMWQVADGTIQVASGGKGMLSTTTEFADYELMADVWIDDKANSGIFLRCPTEGEINGDVAYEVNVYDAHAEWPTGSINNIGRTRARVKTVGKWTPFKMQAVGNRLTVSVDGRKTLDLRNDLHARGTIALQYNGEGTVRFRNIKLRPLTLKSIFNGQDLSGWKVVPGHASVYSVTPQRWLNVKNGNGDIQTEGLWGDFVLQMDIFSNGDHLNSGIFFRANPGRFWEGYEAQIRNQWQGDDRTKPVDYGTGAIYNRQPARKVYSSDREWFTMTIVAHGKHLATWVNGNQVADFTDMRLPNEGNARQGARTAPGVISIQGHDPTTDLSFRNIRIVEMPTGRK